VSERERVTDAPELLRVERLTKHFPVRRTKIIATRQHVHAVDEVTLAVRRGETLGIVGESGCGKSTLGRCMIRLLDLTSGTVVFDGQDISTTPRQRLRALRREMQMVFQDPIASLNPRKTVGTIVSDPLRAHGVRDRQALRRRTAALLEMVGLSPEHERRYPHEFSGGQRQRISVARALALEPRLLIADEPVSALDVSVQAQVVNLLSDLQDDLHLTYVFIAHDLAVVRHISDRIAVMYLGKIVELGAADDVCGRPRHPYTEALLSAAPIPDLKISRTRSRIILHGDLPSAMAPPTGCRFHTRCPYATEICRTDEPGLVADAAGRQVACHHPVGGAPAFPTGATT
jgi:oligopeptide/dipeptide ABC transporter ATP-binding protein